MTSEEEIAEIEEAIGSKGSLEPIAEHLKTALDLYSDRQSPDYRNSMKESISAVEGTCSLIVGSDTTLSDALAKIARQVRVELHPVLKQAFDKLYAYANDTDGIRHAMTEETNLASEDARFMLVACSAFVNYLKVKSSKAGIDLETT